MRNKTFATSLFLICLISFGLSGQGLPNLELSKKMTREGKIKLSTLANEISYIALETNSKCLIDRINEIIELPDQYLITSGHSDVFQFSKDGAYIRTIGQRGQGPKEYPSLGGVFWNNKTEEIILYNNTHYKLFYYDVNGRFLKEVKLPY